jgi:transposase
VAVSPWPTPGATDHKGSRAPGQRRGQLTDAIQDHGALNPAWVEALMGFPSGWTEIEGLGTQSFPQSQKSSAGQS